MICTCETKSEKPGSAHSEECEISRRARDRMPLAHLIGLPCDCPQCQRTQERIEEQMKSHRAAEASRLEREFWERCALQCLGPDPSEIAGAADALTAEWRKRFGEGK